MSYPATPAVLGAAGVSGDGTHGLNRCDAVRPDDWRHVLARQAEALDRTDGIPELDEAVTLLGYEDAS